MQREAIVSTMAWCEKTMTLMKVQQLEACEKRLNAYPQQSVFDDCSYRDVMFLWNCSFYAHESLVKDELLTPQEIQAKVLNQLQEEVCLVSVDEYRLLERMLVFGGETELLDWNESGAAEALIRRLWCTLRWEDDRVFLRLPKPLHRPILSAMDSPECAEARERLFRFDATIHGLLYIAGFLHAQQPAEHFVAEVCPRKSRYSRMLARRYLCSAFDYVFDRQGQMLLIHPGLADYELLVKELDALKISEMELTEGMMLGGMNGIFPQEEPLHYAMIGALEGAVRPEYSEEEAVSDLRMLAKQGVPLSEMREVLASMLITLPTQPMLALLEQISAQTPRWAGLSSSLVQ